MEILLTDEAIARLEQLKADVRANADHFDMSDWFCAEDCSVGRAQALFQERGEIDCGTTCCLSGFLVLRWDTERMLDPEEGEATLYLDDESAEELNSALFHADQWPGSILLAYKQAMERKDCAGMAAAACSAIDHIIAESDRA